MAIEMRVIYDHNGKVSGFLPAIYLLDLNVCLENCFLSRKKKKEVGCKWTKKSNLVLQVSINILELPLMHYASIGSPGCAYMSTCLS